MPEKPDFVDSELEQLFIEEASLDSRMGALFGLELDDTEGAVTSIAERLADCAQFYGLDPDQMQQAIHLRYYREFFDV